MFCASGCARGEEESRIASPEGTIGFPSSEGVNPTYVLITPKTGAVSRLRIKPPDHNRVFLFWYDGARIWTVDEHAVSTISARRAVRRRIPVKASTPDRAIGGVSWSPDGTRLVYTDGGGLFVASVDGRKPRRIVSGADIYQPDWSPRGDRIVFVRDSSFSGDGSIHAIRVNERRPRFVARGTEPDISPDGMKLAFTTAAGVVVMPIAGGMPKLVAPSGAHPEWSPDGQDLAFTRDTVCGDAGCSGRVFVVPAAGGVAHAYGPSQFDIGSLFWVGNEP